METTAKRKDLIKNITIIFLIIMLVLTFFSSTIMNRSLPQVAAQYAYSGQITTSVRMSGTTQANENYQVIIEEGRVIQSVNVRRGDTVNIDDVLFVLEDSESTEMIDALDKLNAAKLAYDKWKLQIKADIEDSEKQIKYELEDLAKIKAKGVSNVSTDAAEKRVKELQKELAGYTLSAAEMAYDKADKAQTAAQDAVDLANDDYTQKQEIYNNLKNNGSAQDQLTTAERRLEDLNITYNRAKDAYDALCVEYNAVLEKRPGLLNELNLAKAHVNDNSGNASIIADNIAMYQAEVERLSSLPNRTEEEEEELSRARGQLAYYQAMQSNISSSDSISKQKLAEAQAAYDANEAKIAQYEEQMKTSKQNLDDQMRTITREQEDYESLKLSLGQTDNLSTEDYNKAVQAALTNMRSAETVLKNKQKVLSDAQSDYSEAKAAYDSAKQNAKHSDTTYTKEQLDKLLKETEAKLESAQEYLESLQNQSSEGYPSLDAYNEAVTTKQRSIDSMKTALERKKAENALSEPTYQDDIERAQKDVDRLSESVGSSVIKAKVAGKINNIAVTAGQKVSAQTVLLEIEQQDKGYTVELSMTTEQAKRVSVGQAASILYYWGTTPEAVVSSIKPSQSDPQNTRIVTLQVTGDITAGQNFTFSLGERSANYDTVVPNSAVREDSNGKFILVVEAKTTPIGNRYTAVRRDVDVIASDEINSAVSGLTGGEFVITTSTTPITQGQQVRLSDT